MSIHSVSDKAFSHSCSAIANLNIVIPYLNGYLTNLSRVIQTAIGMPVTGSNTAAYSQDAWDDSDSDNGGILDFDETLDPFSTVSTI